MQEHHETSAATRACDVAIVGAGPAGSSAALALSRSGADVLLLERETLPRYKTCGGGVVSRALGLLPPDFDLPLERACLDVEMRFGVDGRAFVVKRDRPIVAMVMRAEFDQALATAAVRAGTKMMDACEVVGLETHADRVVLSTSSGIVRARIVIGADGALGATARLAGWTERVHTIPALEAEVKVSEAGFARLCSTARFDLGTPAGGYGWIFPKRGHLSAGVLTMRRGSFDLRGALAGYLERAGATSSDRDGVADADRSSVPAADRASVAAADRANVGASERAGMPAIDRAGVADFDRTGVVAIARRGTSDILSIEHHGYVIPIAPRPGGFARGRVLLVGDAAGLADPLTGEGISYAMRSGQLAARSIIDARYEPAAVRARYRSALRESILPELRVARWLAHVLYRRPKLAARLFDRSGQALCEAVTEVVLGEKSYRELALNPVNYVKLLTSRSARHDRL